VTVAVGDDEPVIIEALTEVLAEEADLTLVGSAPTGDATLALVHEHRPDVVLLDVRMPGGGLAAACRLAAECPGARVVALSAHTDAGTVVDMIQAGAVGFLAKGALTGGLAESIRRAARGEVMFATDSAAAALRQTIAELCRLRREVERLRLTGAAREEQLRQLVERLAELGVASDVRREPRSG
jgi:DNA-binding NarL/FixJ family response regulator